MDAMELARLEQFLEPARTERLRMFAARAREELRGTVVWNVNATAQGGGVAEMLQAILSYGRGAGVDTRWLVLDGDPEFFAITKRLHNVLHGSPGDGGELGQAERRPLREVLEAHNMPGLAELVRPGDIVLLHDPQTAGLVEPAAGAGAPGSCGGATSGGTNRRARPRSGGTSCGGFLDGADAFIFSRRQYAPPWVAATKRVDHPAVAGSVQPEERRAEPADVGRHAATAGLVADSAHRGQRLRSTGAAAAGAGAPAQQPGRWTADRCRERRPVVLQVSRWDRLKDMAGVLAAFADHLGRDAPRTRT